MPPNQPPADPWKGAALPPSPDLVDYLMKTLNMSMEAVIPLAKKLTGSAPFDLTHGASGSAINSALKPQLEMGPVTVGPAPKSLTMGPATVKSAKPGLDIGEVSVSPAHPNPGMTVTPLPDPTRGGLSAWEESDKADQEMLQATPGKEMERLERMKQWADAWVNHPKDDIRGEHTNPYNLSPGGYLIEKPRAFNDGGPLRSYPTPEAGDERPGQHVQYDENARGYVYRTVPSVEEQHERRRAKGK